MSESELIVKVFEMAYNNIKRTRDPHAGRPDYDDSGYTKAREQMMFDFFGDEYRRSFNILNEAKKNRF